MSVNVVTTFSQDGYECYGRRFVQSFLEHAPETPLICYHESFPSIDVIAENLEWRNLDRDPDRKKFIADHGKDPAKVSDARFPNHQSIRFCHKVFAVTDAAERCNSEWLVWLDADVVITGKPEWEHCLPGGSSLSFLGRERYAYSECGFVGYRVADPKVLALLRDMRAYYTTGEIFTRPAADHHDSRCFDICRLRSGVGKEAQCSIAFPSNQTHVWPSTPLARWSQHQKGPRRKMQVYGKVAP